MKKRAVVVLVLLGAMLASVAAGGQIYVPIPPTTGENRLQVLLTNLGAKPTSFRSRIYSPERTPQAQGRFDLQPGQTVTQEQAGSPVAFQVVETASPGVVVSSRLTGPGEAPVRRLPVFTSRDIVQSRKKATFQFFALLEAQEPVSFVVFSVNATTAACSVTLNNDFGQIASLSFAVPQSAAVSAVELSGEAPASFAQVTCNRPFLAFAYRGTAPTAEIVEPSVSQ